MTNMNRREFFQTTTGLALSAAMPIDIMAQDVDHPFIEFAEKNFKIHYFKKGIVPWKATNHHKELAELYDNERFVLVKKYREGGFSTFSVMWALYECMHKKNQSFGIVSRTNIESRFMKERIFDVMQRHLPEELQLQIVRIGNCYVEFKNHSNILFFTPHAACGRMFTTIILDETAFWEDLERKYQLLVPTISLNGKMFMVSIPYRKKQYFYKLWKDSNSFKKFAPSCFEHPDYTPERIKLLKDNLGEKAWRQECLAEFQD